MYTRLYFFPGELPHEAHVDTHNLGMIYVCCNEGAPIALIKSGEFQLESNAHKPHVTNMQAGDKTVRE